MGGSWLDCGLGRPVACSSALDVTEVAAPGFHRHLPSTNDLGVYKR